MENGLSSPVEDESTARDRNEATERRRKAAPSELQRAAKAPPPWHAKRLPFRQAGAEHAPEGDSRAREKAEDDEKERQTTEAANFLLSLKETPTADKAARTTDPFALAASMCTRVQTTTLHKYVRAWRTPWHWWTTHGSEGLLGSSEAVLAYVEQRAGAPCATSTLRWARVAPAFYEEAAGLPKAGRVSQCAWLNTQAEALEKSLTSKARGAAWQTHTAHSASAAEMVTTAQGQSCFVVMPSGAVWKSGVPCASPTTEVSRQQTPHSTKKRW